ncbi:MAG: hypothetical protein HKO93_01925, partial [Flavobacteriales bacterium]|nr:hypothetical protein [Flavobacteriales bacterium]
SPLLNAGSDDDNVGIFNDNYDFDQRGHAADLPYITDLNVLTPAVGQGETLEVNFSAFGN